MNKQMMRDVAAGTQKNGKVVPSKSLNHGIGKKGRELIKELN
jgi:hypothetical protein